MKPWDAFVRAKIDKIISEKKDVVDIGGGLRIKGNRIDPKKAYLKPLVAKINYRVLDPVDTYQPDIVGDIHQLPFKDNEIDAYFCFAVLEHVERPHQAVAEMHRTLKPGGYCLIYVPFLYYYHAERGYYKDYFRYTKDSLEYLFKNFKNVEIQSVRGAIQTWIRISPLGRYSWIEEVAYWLDLLTGKIKSKQVSGYYLFATK